MLPTSTPLPIPGENEAFEVWIKAEAGEGAAKRWLGTQGYENSRVQDYRTGWVAAIEWIVKLMASRAGGTPTYMSDGEKAYRVDVLERWPAHNRARYTIPLFSVSLPRNPEAQEEGETWLVSGSLLYRLTDERRPQNCDEIRVSMADGSREDAACAARALALLPAVIQLTS